jgi:hypothetical protein
VIAPPRLSKGSLRRAFFLPVPEAIQPMYATRHVGLRRANRY